MAKVKLSYAQRTALKNLSDPTHWIRGRNCTNLTLNALKTRGLAKLDWIESDAVSGHMIERWSITTEGKAALS